MRIRKMIYFLKLASSASSQLAWEMVSAEIRRRLYSNELGYGFQFYLGQEIKLPELGFSLMIRELASRDVTQLLNIRQSQIDGPELREIVVRQLLIEARIPTCYVGVTLEDQPCCMCWLIRASQNDLLQTHFRRLIPPLKPGEVLNIWTHPDHRGKRLMMYLTLSLFERARREGAQRAIAYIHEGNASIHGRSKSNRVGASCP